MEDVDCILTIIQDGKQYLKDQGLPQWQNGTAPKQESIVRDIEKGEGYVLLYKTQICGYAALVSGVDEYYTRISEGRWDGEYAEYVSIHRVAVSVNIRGQGLAKTFMHSLVAEAQRLGNHDIRIDTYPDNEIMKKVISDSGFIYRGMIEFPIPNGERNAYQLLT